MTLLRKHLVLLLTVAAALAWTRPARADLDVVATVPSLAAIAKAVGGSHVDVTSLALPTQDPHFVDAKPSLALALNKADLLVVVGLSLEGGWLPTLQTGARNAAIQKGGDGYFDASSVVRILDKPQTVDRSHGDIHPGGSPHYLYDPRAASAIAKGIAQRMSKLDPTNAAGYQNNLRQFQLSLAAKKKTWEQKLAPFKKQPIIGYHKTWAYLVDWLDLEPVAYLEPKAGIPPTPAHVAKVIGVAQSKKVRVILQEAFYPEATAKLVAQKAGSTLVILPGGPNHDKGESYLAHMDQVVDLLAKGFTP